MAEKDVEAFKNACKEYFHTVNLNVLRAYGRALQLRKPTAMRKKELSEEIISVLCGETVPQRNGKKGAPIKVEYGLQEIFDKIDGFKKRYAIEEMEQERVSPSLDGQEGLVMQCSGLPRPTLSAECAQKQLFLAFLSSL